MTIRTAPIVVGVDGSEAARGAVHWAVDEAVRHGRHLKIVHGLGMPQPFTWPIDASALLQEAEDLAKRWQPALEVETALGIGAAGPVLVEESTQAALVVVGCRGRSPRAGLVLGSVGMYLAEHATCPVLVVHHAERWAGRAQPLPQSGPIVVGVDGSPTSLRALGLAFEEAAARNAPLVVLQAAADTGAPGSLSELTLWRAKFPAVEVHLSIRHSGAEVALADASRTAVMLVLGEHGHDAFPGLRVGQRLVHQAYCPVLIAHAAPSGS